MNTFDEKVQTAVQEFEIRIQRAVQEEVSHRLNAAFEMAHREKEGIEEELGSLFDTETGLPRVEENGNGKGSNGHRAAEVEEEPTPDAVPEKPKSKKSRKGSANEQAVEKVAAFVKNHPGLRSEEIQKTSGMNSNLVKKALDRLREEGRVRTQGQKRATTYTLLA